MSAFGLFPDAHQRKALDVICSVRSDEPARWSALEAAIVEARQNGKTAGVLLPLALYAALRRPDQLIVWSAHRYKTAREAFLAMEKLRRRSRLLRDRIVRVVYSNGEEAFEFRNGSRIVFVARSQASGRGLSGDVVFLDEGLFVTAEMLGALMPTLSAREDPLIVYASSACLPESLVLRTVVDRGRTGGDPDLAYIEWCAPPPGSCELRDCDHAKDKPGCMLDDPANWRAANPGRVPLEYIRKERKSAMSVAEFMRERMGWHDEAGGAALMSAADWKACLDPSTTVADIPMFGIDVPIDRSSTSIGLAGNRSDDLLHVELIEERHGTDWVIPWFKAEPSRRQFTVAIDTGSQAGTFIQDLEQLGVTVIPLGMRDVARASGRMYDAVREHQLRHGPQPELDEAVAGAAKRPLAESWAFGRRHSMANISPLMAVTFALAGLMAGVGHEPVNNIW